MNIFFFQKFMASPMTLRMGHSRYYIISMGFLILVSSGIFFTGKWFGEKTSEESANGKMNAHTASKQQKKVEREELAYLLLVSRELGFLQASVISAETHAQNIDRVTRKIGRLNVKKFDFSSLPGQGGAEKSGDDSIDKVKLLNDIIRMTAEIKGREITLNALETFLLYANLKRQSRPAGAPVVLGRGKARVTSRYGVRTDPMNGRKTFHDGIDYGARTGRGTPIYTVASGIVSASGRRGGYGITVEIDHGNGIVSRYAHNSRLLVSIGQKVRKGQKIALMGSTGRSTGPHVHYEVLKNGKAIDPNIFMRKRGKLN